MAAKKVKLPFLGTLVYEGGDVWQKTMQVSLFGFSYAILVQVDIDEETGIEEVQLDAIEHWSNKQSEVLLEVQNAVSEYRREQLESLDGHEDLDKTIADSESMRINSVVFPYYEDVPTFGFLLDCDWDPDNGIGVRVESGRIRNIGTQSILL